MKYIFYIFGVCLGCYSVAMTPDIVSIEEKEKVSEIIQQLGILEEKLQGLIRRNNDSEDFCSDSSSDTNEEDELYSDIACLWADLEKSPLAKTAGITQLINNKDRGKKDYKSAIEYINALSIVNNFDKVLNGACQ